MQIKKVLKKVTLTSKKKIPFLYQCFDFPNNVPAAFRKYLSEYLLLSASFTVLRFVVKF